MRAICSWLQRVLGLSPACRARQALRDRHPDWQVWTGWMSHRATEPGRAVVAVFYRQPGHVCFPPTGQYKLFAVTSDLNKVEELPDSPDSPYLIHGLK
jgi:hypothetical protein